MTIDDRLADVYDAAGVYLTALDAIEGAVSNHAFLEAVCRRDLALAELRAARYPKDAG